MFFILNHGEITSKPKFYSYNFYRSIDSVTFERVLPDEQVALIVERDIAGRDAHVEAIERIRGLVELELAELDEKLGFGLCELKHRYELKVGPESQARQGLARVVDGEPKDAGQVAAGLGQVSDAHAELQLGIVVFEQRDFQFAFDTNYATLGDLSIHTTSTKKNKSFRYTKLGKTRILNFEYNKGVRIRPSSRLARPNSTRSRRRIDWRSRPR